MRTSLLSATTQTGSWLVLLAAVLWGTTGTAQAFAPESASPTAIGAVRLAVGGIALLVIAITRKNLLPIQKWPLIATVVSAASMAAYQPFFFAGVARTGVAVGTLVAIGGATVLAGLLGYLVRKEPLKGEWFAATFLAILGCGLLIAASGEFSVDVLGILLALCAGAAYATYAVVSKGLLKDRPPDAVLAVVFCLAALILSPYLIQADLSWLKQPSGLAVALHLGVIATATAYALFARGLTLVPVANAVTLTLAEPLTASLLGTMVLGERLTFTTLAGMGLLLAGLAILAFASRTQDV